MRAVGRRTQIIAALVQNAHFFSMSQWSFSGSQDVMIRVGFRMLVAMSCAQFHFLLHCVITIHQRYKQTDGRHARSAKTVKSAPFRANRKR